MRIPATRLSFLLVLLTLGLSPAPVLAAPETHEYRVEHALYGTIGTLSNAVSRSGDTVEVETRVHIVVKVFGMVIYRQEAHRQERWRSDRLVKYRSVTSTNGNRIEVQAETNGKELVIRSPQGTTVAKGRVRTSNPWSADILDSDLLMSAKTGELAKTEVAGSRAVEMTLGGKARELRQFETAGDDPQIVWLGEDGVPVAFRTEEQGMAVDFVSTRYQELTGEIRRVLRAQSEAGRPGQPATRPSELAARPAEAR
jgi:hypothetical protein